MAAALRFPRFGLPHCRIFADRYRVIDDLVDYILNPEMMQENQENIGGSSGFTVAMGILVSKIMEQFRRNALFEMKMQKIVDKCFAAQSSLAKLATVLEQVTNFVPILELKEDIFYFFYFAITCEICERFAYTELEEFIDEVKESAKVALFVYWNNGSKCAELDRFAQVIIHGVERDFCGGIHFDVVKHFLMR